MALNLKDISGDTPIRGFDEIYNDNNTNIENYIASLESTISELQSEINSMEESHSKKIKEIAGKLTTMTSELKDTIGSYIASRYDALLPELAKSNEVIKVLRETLNTILTNKFELSNKQITTLKKNVNNVLETELYTE